MATWVHVVPFHSQVSEESPPGPAERPTSATLTRSLNVLTTRHPSGRPECEVRVQVAERSSSGEHKFKLKQVAVRSE